jgi:U3 small nucleolar RNA-associated protein 22
MSLEAAFGHSISATEDYVDVLTEGFAFRLLFHSSRDEAMLAKEESGLTSYDPRRHAIVSSWHHGLISAVASVNPAFAPATRLAKRWVGSQLLSNHLCDEAIELLMVSAFTSPSPTPTAPGSRLSGRSDVLYPFIIPLAS